MRCSLPPHRETLVFSSYEEFDSHYSKDHSHRCLECGRNLPSPHMLDLHHEECHDTFVALKREKGEHTFSCFVEGCDRKCMTPQKRRLHLIDKHMYPKNFFFAVTRDGIDGRRSMLLEGGHRQRRPSTTTPQARRDSLTNTVRAGQKAMKQSDAADGNPIEEPFPVCSEPHDVEMDGLAGALSSLKFVPRGLQFGRGGGKAGFAKRQA